MGNLTDLAIVIPTLNEEKYIGNLLDSIASQSVLPKEVIVVDAYSEDKTLSEIKKRQKALPHLKVYQVEKSTISKQRNFGVKKTKSENILFLDADMKLLDKDTLEKYMAEIEAKKPDIAIAENIPLTSDLSYLLHFKMLHTVCVLSSPIWPSGTAMNMFVKRSTFNKVKGFDENVRIWEDSDLLQRMSKNKAKSVFLKNPKLYTSARRLKKEGVLNMNLKTLLAFSQILLFGFKGIKVKYEFGKYKN